MPFLGLVWWFAPTAFVTAGSIRHLAIDEAERTSGTKGNDAGKCKRVTEEEGQRSKVVV